MSGVRRFLSRREKSPSTTHRGLSRHRLHDHEPKPARQPDHFGGVFSAPEGDPQRKPDKEEEKKIKGILERFRHYGIENLVESNVEYALRATNPPGDAQAAFGLLMLLEDTYEGIVKPYDPDVKMRGAVNRQGVSCYLDALLFAMFAKLDSFEAMLYENFHDIKRRRLAGLLRLWANMLRTGKLITTDVTEHIQNAMADLGWLDASRTMQQDPSEAFTFITGQLELPMLTLKMDMYHTGKEDPQDDHKFVNERLLEVALLDEPSEGNTVLTLEDCLEHYFNNRIEVKRHMENQRRNTLKSVNSNYSGANSGGRVEKEKESGTHIEVVDLGEGPETPTASTPMAQTPIAESPLQLKTQVEKLRTPRRRADSIFSQRKVELTGIDPETLKQDDPHATVDAKGRKLSTRTEVLMPAWQFFKLLPWYTDNMPTSDAQVAAHFSKKRPVLGICLKRYSYTNTGQARKLDTYVDIPLEIAVPNFVGDDSMDDDSPLVGNFRLMLQSVVCHRGVSVNSGHYVCLCRGRRSMASAMDEHNHRGSDASEDFEDPWMRFDDLAPERITQVDIHEALRQEMPYLLFYQVMPIGDDGHSIHDLPSYAEATSRSQSDTTTLEKPLSESQSRFGSDLALAHTASDPTAIRRPLSTEVTDFAPPTSERTSLDASTALDGLPRGRASISAESGPRRASMNIDDAGGYAESTSAGSVRTDPTSNSVPSTPSEEKTSGLLAVANKFSSSRRGSRVSRSSGATSKSRAHSTDPDGGAGGAQSSASTSRFSLNMSRLTQRVSRSETASTAAFAEGSTAGVDPSAIGPPPSTAPTPTTPTANTSSSTLAIDPDTAASVSTQETSDSASTLKPLPPLPQQQQQNGKSAFSGSRKEKLPAKEKEKRKIGPGGGKGHHEDRDCVVM